MKQTKEENKIINEKLKQLNIDLKKREELEISEKVKYRPLKDYDNSSHKTYKFVNIGDIEIYLTPTTRLESAEKKYKLARPLFQYLEQKNEEEQILYQEFIEMVKRLDIDKINELEEKQKEYKNKLPFEIKYKDNYIWDIYYSEIDDKYFMMFPTEEPQVESLFYIISKKMKAQKNKKSKELLYTSINNKPLDYDFLKRTEVNDLENYLWYFTGNWPTIYELEENGETTIQIVGQTHVYEKIDSLYKIILKNKEEAQKQFKLIKALFILQSNMEQEYKFKTGLDEDAKINFFYNHNKMKYDTLPEFIKIEVEKKIENIEKLQKQNAIELEKYILLKETIEKQSIEYMLKEKQIVTFLECKKSFFGKVSYFFKGKKKNRKKEIVKNENIEQNEEIKINKIKFEKKEKYTIEDLLKVGTELEKQEKEYKDKQMDIKALENKKENLENKIKNATLYINEIESHKKSIFDFWKYTNKYEVTLLNEGTEQPKEQVHNKIEKSFLYEDDIEDLSKKIDEKQRIVFNQKEQEAIFAIYKDLKTFNIVSKDKILKKDEKEIEKILNNKKKQYAIDYEKIKEKDFDIFGNVVEDNTKIKILNNNKHREIEKDEYKILDIHLDTQTEQYKENIINYKNILENCYNKMTSPIDMPIYKLSNKTIEDEKLLIININAKDEIENNKEEAETLILNRINIKENMPFIFYSNIMFFDNLNQTLPLGMDITQKVLVNLQEYEYKLVSRKDFNMNYLKDEYNNVIKKIKVYEYEIKRKE